MSNHSGDVTHESRELGVIQGDSIRKITSDIDNIEGSYFYTNSRGTNPGNLKYDVLPDTYMNLYAAYYNPNHINTRIYRIYVSSINENCPIDNEIRPINTAVRWIIKAL